MRTWHALLAGLAFSCGLAASAVRADTVQLVNGDTVSGQVVAMDAKQLKLTSKLLGNLSIEREKIRAIFFGDAPPASMGRPEEAKQPPGGASPEDVVRQLRQQGLDESVRSQLQREFPLLGASGPQQYFNDTISGLISGKLSLQDIRKDAINARTQLLDLQKDLGPEAAAALSPYMGILDRFIRETEPPQSQPAEKKGP